ncbi:segregation/condensation protein A [[Brevibacterium] frigoritolerans]|nr:segregation/condensation protein A [Peribacillus frigoritolerans]
MENIVIRFDEFEGPMDLLVELIKKRELDIYDLPMSVITKDFIKNIELMKEKDIEVTSNFTEMASLLLKIKTQMLLPSTKEDPRNQLVKEIEEYEKYKSNLETLKELHFIEQKYFKRTKRDISKKKKTGSIIDVLQSYNLIMRKKQLKERNLKLEELSKKLSESKISIDDQMHYLKNYPDGDINVLALFEKIDDLEEMVVTFSALLELVKVQFFRIEIQDENVILTRKV